MEKRERKNNKNKSINWHGVIVILLFLISFSLIAFIIYFNVTKPIEVRAIEVRFTVAKKLGFDLNGSALTFGTVFPGGTSARNISLGNERNFPIIAEIFFDENTSKVIISDANVSVGSKEKVDIPFLLSIPKNYSEGNYTGKLIFKIYKA